MVRPCMGLSEEQSSQHCCLQGAALARQVHRRTCHVGPIHHRLLLDVGGKLQRPVSDDAGSYANLELTLTQPATWLAVSCSHSNAASRVAQATRRNTGTQSRQWCEGKRGLLLIIVTVLTGIGLRFPELVKVLTHSTV